MQTGQSYAVGQRLRRGRDRPRGYIPAAGHNDLLVMSTDVDGATDIGHFVTEGISFPASRQPPTIISLQGVSAWVRRVSIRRRPVNAGTTSKDCLNPGRAKKKNACANNVMLPVQNLAGKISGF